jgi:hypothetical protein
LHIRRQYAICPLEFTREMAAGYQSGYDVARIRMTERWLPMKKVLVLAIALFVSTAFGADIGGNWKGTADFGGNALERTFTFKVDGKKLTGETSSQMMGKSVINDGVIDGDNISFTITGSLQGNEMKLTYKGKVEGNTIKLSSDANGNTIEWVLRKE